MVSLGFKPGATGYKAQTISVGYLRLRVSREILSNANLIFENFRLTLWQCD